MGFRSSRRAASSVSTLKLVTFAYIMAIMLSLTCGSRVFNIHFNTSNPIFRIDNTDHIIDVNRDNLPYDQVNIICPVYTPGTSEEDTEKYIIYNVSKEEYDTCRITNPNPRIIAVCDKPYKLMYFTITFRSFTPQPGGLEFRPGQDYYFISTSSRDDLHRRVGGRCATHNMKVVFKVCCRPGETSVHSTTGAPVVQQAAQVPRLPASSTLRTTAVTTSRRPVIVYTTSSTSTPSTTAFPHKSFTTSRYSPKRTDFSPTKIPPKRKDQDHKHHNEVLTNQLKSSSSTSTSSSWSQLTFTLILLLRIWNPFQRLS